MKKLIAILAVLAMMVSVVAMAESADPATADPATAPLVSETTAKKDKTSEPTPDTPSAETPDTPSAETPDTPSAETPDTPSAETPDTPSAETPDTPSAETPDTPSAETPDTPAPAPVPTTTDTETWYYDGAVVTALGADLKVVYPQLKDSTFVVPVDLSKNGFYSYPLVADGKWLVGHAEVTVYGDTVSVVTMYTPNVYKVQAETLAFYNKTTDLVLEEVKVPTHTFKYHTNLSIANDLNGDDMVLMYIHNFVNHSEKLIVTRTDDKYKKVVKVALDKAENYYWPAAYRGATEVAVALLPLVDAQ